MPAALVHNSGSLATFGEVAPPMIVDVEHNLGFVLGRTRNQVAEPGDYLGMYDLASMRLLGRIRLATVSFSSNDIFRFTLDPVRERLLEPADPGAPDPSCSGQPQLSTIEYGVVAGKRTLRTGRPIEMPCAGLFRIVPTITSVFIDRAARPPRRKLYIYGTYWVDTWRSVLAFDLQDNAGQPLVIQQIDLAKLDAGAGAAALDWQFDLRYAGCGRIAVPFVQRVGNSVFSYCSDARPGIARSGSLSEQGYVVRIPLDERDQPAVTGGSRVPDHYDPVAPAATNFQVRRTPALAGSVVPFADPVTGTILLLSNDAANGNATWIFDPIAERFVGVITGGDANQPPDKNAAGFDGRSGRTYLLTSTGVLMSQTRQRPLPTGTIYDVLSRPEDRTLVPQIAVAPKLRRLFVPMLKDEKGKGRAGYAVIEDDVPDPRLPQLVDPDRNTAQIREDLEATQLETRGAAEASGAHLIAVGGIARTFDQIDPLCTEPAEGLGLANERSYFDDRCVWEVLVANGHREMFFAPTSVEAGNTTGTVAEASGLAFAQSDHADQDVKRAGECYRSSAQEVLTGGSRAAGGTGDEWSSLQPLFDVHRDGCEQAGSSLVANGGPDLSSGTRGPDDEGFPVKRSECAAFDAAESNEQPADPPLQSSSAVTCEPAAAKATADAVGAAVALPSLDGAIVTVARTSSSVRSLRTARGQETIVEAVAEGVRIGPLQIGEIRTTATTRAKGRTGTAAASLTRRWCRVHVDGEPPIEDCVDPSSPETRALIDQVNQVLGRIRIGVPEARSEATPGGYQAVVTKDPDVRAADEAVNDDDTHTVSGLELVLYNDGPEGRNRLVLQLAGVHAESRYAIQPIPDYDTEPSIIDRLGPPEAPVVDGGPPTRPNAEQEPVLKRVFRKPAELIRRGIELLVNNPREFALLFLLLVIIATPVFLAIRRSIFETEVTS